MFTLVQHPRKVKSQRSNVRWQVLLRNRSVGKPKHRTQLSTENDIYACLLLLLLLLLCIVITATIRLQCCTFIILLDLGARTFLQRAHVALPGAEGVEGGLSNINAINKSTQRVGYLYISGHSKRSNATAFEHLSAGNPIKIPSSACVCTVRNRKPDLTAKSISSSLLCRAHVQVRSNTHL